MGIDAATIADQYRAVRRCTENLCQPLEPEDFILQSMPDASPVKWHLAHTTWFFEAFVLAKHAADYQPFHPQFNFLFNSYYNAVGPRWPRPERGLLSRPSIEDIRRYRAHVDDHLGGVLQSSKPSSEVLATLVLGLNHEQQHQELIITDLKHAWSVNPLHPVYREAIPAHGRIPELRWLTLPGGVTSIGFDGSDFAFDNESPRHRVFLNEFKIANRLATNGDYLAFMADGGYERPELWLSDGWAARQAKGWNAPLYWHRQENDWFMVTLSGLRHVAPDEPICHISFYEADAFARWSGARLPAEAEWECAAAQVSPAGHFLEAGRFHPAATPASGDRGPIYQLYGDVWQWTASPYLGYPGYRPAAGALGEYNGKFMCNQFVLRGASCATPRSHARLTYRNFFPPDARWQFSGVRLAKDSP